jgi:hypothetical protein
MGGKKGGEAQGCVNMGVQEGCCEAQYAAGWVPTHFARLHGVRLLQIKAQ